MKIVIIGGSGFVGTKLIDLLKSEGYNITNIDKNSSKHYPHLTVVGNVLDKEKLTLLLKGADLVVLLAAEHRDDVSPTSLYYDVNVLGMRNTLQAMEVNGVTRILFTSSVAVYGLDKSNPTEDSSIDPFNDYGISKWQAEQVLQDWYKTHCDWTIQVLRPSVIFGEGNRGNVFNLLRQIASGKFLMIGSGENKKSMAYVRNVVAFIHFLILQECKGYYVYNYVDKPDFSTNDLVFHTGNILGQKIPAVRIPYWLGLLGGYGFDILAYLTKRKFTISSVRVKKFCAVTQFDASKVENSGFVAPFTLEEGLKNMLDQEFGKSYN